ncbi:MAG: NAD(P)H-dependent oxidoreductase [Saprospiraceae bacterium]
MTKILVLFAHPALEKSRVNQQLIKGLDKIQGVTFHDLYEAYPDFDVDVEREQQLLLRHDIIILHHPFYWYSAPPLTKQWIDLVLEHGWAYGRVGKALLGKKMLNVITVGGQKQAYCEQGYNMYTIRQFLFPFEQTARLCSMHYLPPIVVHGTHRMQPEDIITARDEYHTLLRILISEQYDTNFLQSFEYLNHLLQPAYNLD